MSFLALFVWQAISLHLDVTATLDGGSTFWWISTPRCIFIHTKPTKGTSLVISASFEPLHIFIRRLVRAVRESQKGEIKKKKVKNKAERRYISHIWGEETAHTIATNISLLWGLGDVINHIQFSLYRYSRFSATWGQIWGSPIGNKKGS